jgi:hypothetical protein
MTMTTTMMATALFVRRLVVVMRIPRFGRMDFFARNVHALTFATVAGICSAPSGSDVGGNAERVVF